MKAPVFIRVLRLPVDEQKPAPQADLVWKVVVACSRQHSRTQRKPQANPRRLEHAAL